MDLVGNGIGLHFPLNFVFSGVLSFAVYNYIQRPSFAHTQNNRLGHMAVPKRSSLPPYGRVVVGSLFPSNCIAQCRLRLGHNQPKVLRYLPPNSSFCLALNSSYLCTLHSCESICDLQHISFDYKSLSPRRYLLLARLCALLYSILVSFSILVLQ